MSAKKKKVRQSLVETSKGDSKELSMSLFSRAVIGAIMLILGFNLSHTGFFKENPLYGVNFLAETMISITSALIGFYIIPRLFNQLKSWVETLIINTVSDIVSNFWEQQSRRMSERKRDKQKQKSDGEKKKFEEEILNSVLVDTSVLIDGRLLEIVKTGFFDKVLIIPGAVLNELHLISDSSDKLKRERGRRGLDVVKKIKGKAKVISPSLESKEKDVDKKLLDFAKRNKIKLLTQDFNLNKLSKASGVKVLNINELVEAVKVSVLPGEFMEVEITHEGKEKKQGVGYMPDGTMIVVEGARTKIGEVVKAKVMRVIQSQAGKIIFCETK